MKKILKSLVLVAAAVAALTSCEKAPETNPTPEEFTLTVNAALPAPESGRTYLGDRDGDAYPVLWSEDDKIRISQVPYYTADCVEFEAAGKTSSPYSKSITRSADNTTAFFEMNSFSNAPAENANFFDYLAIYGGSDYELSKRDKYSDLQLTLPASQKPAVGQFDPKAAVMCDAVLGESEVLSSIDLNFKHLAAYAMLNVTGLDCGDETVESVTITSAEHTLAGVAYWYYLEGTKFVPKSEAASSITVYLPSQPINSRDFEVYFAAIPTKFAANDELTFVVTTNANTYTKEVAVASAFAFEQGKILDFSVNFAGIDADEEEIVVGDNYELVTDLSDFLEKAPVKKIILVVEKEGKYYAATTYNSGKYEYAEVKPSSDVITLADDSSVEVFTLGEYNGKWTLSCKSQSGKYLGYNSGTNFKNSDTYTETDFQWTIAASENATNKVSIINVKTNTRGILYQFGTVNKFGAYATSNVTNAQYSEPYIYKKVN